MKLPNFIEKPTKKTKIRAKSLIRKTSRFFIFFKILLIVILLVTSFYLVFEKYRFFDVSTVEVEGTQSFVNKQDLAEVAKSRVSGENIFWINTTELREILLNNFQGAKDIQIAKKFPRTVKILVVERMPLALIFSNKSSDVYMIDEDGYVLGLVDASKSNLPKILYDKEIKISEFIERSFVPVYLDLLGALDAEKISASSFSAGEGYIRFYIQGKVEILVGESKDKNQSISILSDLLNQLAREGKNLRRVDLRYDKVVVEYQ